MLGPDIVVFGGSAGALQSLIRIVPAFPSDWNAAVFVVVHYPAGARSMLPHILQQAGRLPGSHARDGEDILHGRIYVAPPDHHLLVMPGTMRLTNEPRENGCRPAIDALFRSAAHAFGTRVIAVLLSGMLDDGTLGLAEIKKHGGFTIVLDPKDAEFPSMPRSAIEHVAVDLVLPVEEIGPALLTLVAGEFIGAA